MNSTETPPTGRPHYGRWKQAAGLVFTAGLVPRDAARNVIGSTVEEQTRAVLEMLKALLAEAGCEKADLVKVHVYLADMADFQKFDAVYAKAMGPVAPVRTTIGCALNGVMVEIDAIACPGGASA